MTFLSEVADHLLKKHGAHLGNCTVIFPNRRAGLFLKKRLSAEISRPVWAPAIMSLEDFLFQFSTIQKSDPLLLIFELYSAFKSHQPTDRKEEGFDQFYFWGEMLLWDFEEVDHYLVNPDQLFSYVKSDREIAEGFHFLDEQQKKIIKQFWEAFFPDPSKSQNQFVATWRMLAPVYKTFKQRLYEKGIGYTSHIYRSIADQMEGNPLSLDGPLIFAGFNALTPVEEKLIKHFKVECQAEILWDIDRYYLENTDQEAGNFLRKYQKDSVFADTFPKTPPDRINDPKKLSITGVALEVGQAKLIGQQIQQLLNQKIASMEEMVIVLPEDHMLFPILNVLPPEVTKLNITMGYPLKETPLFGLLEAAIELQEHKLLTPEHWITFYHKPVLDILSHPYLYESDKKRLDSLMSYIKKNNQIRVLQQDILELNAPLLNVIFSDRKVQDLAAYLLEITKVLDEQVVERFGLERAFIRHFQSLLSRLHEILSFQEVMIDLKTFKSLFQKASRTLKIPFSGEPVEGLQVMGVLETRNLDFSYVFMPNMNEGTFPATQRNGSFVPYRIRKAFHLPTFEVQDAIYAYLFYRLFQHGKSLSFYYNSYADFGLSGEVSRFLRQIDHESKIEISKYTLSNSIQIRDRTDIVIEKTPDIITRLMVYTQGGRSKLSPSAINTYLDCRLRFYFKYVLRLFSEDELNDELSPRDFGNILHKVMELLYEDATKEKPVRIIEKTDFFKLKSSVAGAIEKSFRAHFKLRSKQKFQLKGRNLIMAEVMTKFVNKTLELDENYAPFEIMSLENDQNGNYDHIVSITPDQQEFNVVLKGIIDRVDRKYGRVRVIDYKSGRDTTEIGSVEKVFDPTPVSDNNKSRNKAGFQTLYYAWLYAAKYGLDDPITPGILNIQELFTVGFDERLKIKGEPIEDARPLLSEFEDRFKRVLLDIYGMGVPFDQTTDLKKCSFCDFKGICGR